MDLSRRKFLKMAGVAAVAGAAIPAGFQLTPKDAFASSSSHGEAATEEHLGKHLGMVIDMRKFYGKPELIEKVKHACHSVHNVPDIREDNDPNGKPDARREVKWIFDVPFENAFIEHSNRHMSDMTKENNYLVLCNHCAEPSCVRVCPTQATFINKKNGVVAMDYHRCIGCRFCMVACPYGARSFNWEDPRPYIKEYNRHFASRTRGVVEKCNFCSERLPLGQAPACVDAVKDVEGITFGDLNDPHSEIRKVLAENHTLQRKPSAGTKPSVFYIV